MLHVYTDGSCCGNGKDLNTGGFGVVVLHEDKLIRAYAEREDNTTNNRQEMKAIIYAMKNLPSSIVFSDSSYCVNTFTNWMFGWERRGWIKSDKKTPENLDLIQEYFELFKKGNRIDLRLIKGHSGNKWNDVVDKLATGKLSSKEAFKIYG